MNRSVFWVWIAVALVVGGAAGAGCQRKPKNASGAAKPPEGAVADSAATATTAKDSERTTAEAKAARDRARANPDRVEPPAVRPAYELAEDLREKYPEIAAFVRKFMETCLTGDYRAYRGMVSVQRAPESRDRFAKIFHAIKSVRVESIEEIALPQIPPPVYLVVSDVELHPDKKVALREKERKIAILVFREQDDWRMLPAPSQLQPHTAKDEAPDDQQAQSPDYPWDDDSVDY